MQGTTISDDVVIMLEKELAAWFDEEGTSDAELKQAETRLAKLRKTEKNLKRLAIEEGISFRDFREHRSEIEAERAKLNNMIETIKSRRNLIRADFEITLSLANQLDFLFEKGTFDGRRLLVVRNPSNLVAGVGFEPTTFGL